MQSPAQVARPVDERRAPLLIDDSRQMQATILISKIIAGQLNGCERAHDGEAERGRWRVVVAACSRANSLRQRTVVACVYQPCWVVNAVVGFLATSTKRRLHGNKFIIAISYLK